jgi:hypothetical protein
MSSGENVEEDLGLEQLKALKAIFEARPLGSAGAAIARRRRRRRRRLAPRRVRRP